MKEKKLLNNFFLISIVFSIILLTQFFLGKQQLNYGFFIDDWDNLAAYKMYVTNPILSLPYAWTMLGSHRFAHVYYIGILFEFFKYNYIDYNIVNQFLKALSAISLFPVIYLLFKNRTLAFLATFIYLIHFSTFGTLDDVSRGEDFLAIICMNLFLVLYIWSSQKKLFNFKLVISLLLLFASSVFFAPSRMYPLIILFPILELLNYLLNRKATNLKLSLLKVACFYSPFFLILILSPGTILSQVGYYKGLWGMLKLGNFQLFIAPLASFGSLIIPKDQVLLFGPPYFQKLNLFTFSLLPKMAVIFIPLFAIIGFSIRQGKKFILGTSLISFLLSYIIFGLANLWLHLDPKTRASVDPSAFFIQALIGSFMLACASSIYREWVKSKQKNPLLLGLAIAPFLSFLYIFMTWVLTDVNSIFTGIHAYLNIPAMGISVFFAITIYLIFERFRSEKSIIVANLFIIFIIFGFYTLSANSINQYFSYWLKNGLAATDQERMLNIFWQEIGRNKQYSNDNPALIYLDGFQEYENGMYYENAFVWRIPAYLLVETGKTLTMCDLIMYKVEINKLKLVNIGGKQMIVQDRCCSTLIYPIENFFAFKLINRTIVPNKSEVLKQLTTE